MTDNFWFWLCLLGLNFFWFWLNKCGISCISKSVKIMLLSVAVYPRYNPTWVLCQSMWLPQYFFHLTCLSACCSILKSMKLSHYRAQHHAVKHPWPALMLPASEFQLCQLPAYTCLSSSSANWQFCQPELDCWTKRKIFPEWSKRWPHPKFQIMPAQYLSSPCEKLSWIIFCSMVFLVWMFRPLKFLSRLVVCQGWFLF